jgi:hypothetical protein
VEQKASFSGRLEKLVAIFVSYVTPCTAVQIYRQFERMYRPELQVKFIPHYKQSNLNLANIGGHGATFRNAPCKTSYTIWRHAVWKFSGSALIHDKEVEKIHF